MGDIKGNFEYGYDKSTHCFMYKYLLKAIEKALSRVSYNSKTAFNLKVLDAGCGNGYIAGCLLKKGFLVAGFDTSVSGIEQARIAHPEAKFEVLSAYEDIGTYFGSDWDVIISCEVIEHLYDPRSFILNLKNVLKPGGLLILTTVYNGYLKNLLLALSGKMDQHFTALWDCGHIKFWSSKTIRVILEEQDFIDLKFHNAGRLPFLWKSMVVSCIKD